MTPDQAIVMQAAERLRRWDAGGNPYADEDGLPMPMTWARMRSMDCETLARAFLSILPKGERPVPMEGPESLPVGSAYFWHEIDDYGNYHSVGRGTVIERDGHKGVASSGGVSFGGYSYFDGYSREPDAWLGLEWRFFDEWRARASAVRAIVDKLAAMAGE